MNDHRQKMKDLLPIIQAYCDGADVEVYDETFKEWQAISFPRFDAISLMYRIKKNTAR